MKIKLATLALTSVLSFTSVPAMAATQNSGNISIEGNGQSTQTINVTNTTNVTNNNYQITFHDVKGHWAEKAIEELTKKGLLAGDGKGRFNPENTVTREQFATLVAKMFKLEAASAAQDFEDVNPDRWSFKFVEASKDYMVAFKAPDGDLLFYPERAEQRQDVVVTLVKLLEAQGFVKVMDPDSAEALLKLAFKDWEKIAPALRPYVATAFKHGLVKGSDGKFMPHDHLTRAQAATVLKNAQDLMIVVPK